ncbi:helix-turn-helix domain-containing protein [Rhodococcus pyridinivorans]|uniref:helix-turn-helix domain-containing protein n=1 Tax=Rhodococcus pyridinivorans TaxID=103816 RepID=UPI0022852F5A|nr:hypothetical protein [Rhodococcus pyridinivorans]WAL46788.1 hypothetical protein OQN32_01360 [Rhodococcus pyridinivorans]
MTSWTDETAKRIGKAIQEARGKTRTAQWLADRTRDLGHPISRTAISEYENGKRKTMPVTDLVVISAALNVPPALLLYPAQPDDMIEYLPAQELRSIDAVQAFAGERTVINETRESIALLRLARRWRALVADIAALEHAQALAGDADDEMIDSLLPGQSYRKRLETAREERDEVRAAITKLTAADA